MLSETIYNEGATKRLEQAVRDLCLQFNSNNTLLLTKDYPIAIDLLDALEDGADPNLVIDRLSVLHSVTRLGVVELVDALLSKGASIDLSVSQPQSLFCVAIFSMQKYHTFIDDDPDIGVVDVSKIDLITQRYTQIIDLLFDYGLGCTPDDIEKMRYIQGVRLPDKNVDPLVAFTHFPLYPESTLPILEKFLYSGCDPKPLMSFLTKNPSVNIFNIYEDFFKDINIWCAQYDKNAIGQALDEEVLISNKKTTPRQNRII